MPRRIPRFDVQFSSEADKAVQIALAGERIRSSAALGSTARQELSINRIEALYETAYLRVFLSWEDFLEQTFLRYLCGYTATSGTCILRRAPFMTIADAEADVLGRSNFVNWADPVQVVARSRRYIDNGFHETVLQSDLTRVSHFKSIRNRIAHSSEHARVCFDDATRALALRRYVGSSPGRFLRDEAVSIPTPQSWLELIATELQHLAAQICS